MLQERYQELTRDKEESEGRIKAVEDKIMDEAEELEQYEESYLFWREMRKDGKHI